MTVATTTSKSGPYAGSGTTGPFTVAFRFLENSHLKVVKTSTAGVESTLVLTTDYTVTGAGATSGTVTLTSALATGEKLTIIRNVPFTQETDYVQNDAFPAESHERALDKLTMETQQLQEAVSRALLIPVSSTADSAALTADVILLADNVTDINTVAGNIADVVTVGDNIGDVNIVADNIVDVTNFADVYQGAKAADPTLRNDGTALQPGDLYFNTGTLAMRVYGSGVWNNVGVATPVTVTTQRFSGTGAQTVFTLTTAPAFQNACEVYISGVAQVPSVDYTVTGSPSLTTLTFTTAPPSGTNNIFTRSLSAYAGGVPNDGSVSTAKLAPGVVAGLTPVTLDPATDTVAISDASDSGNVKKALLPAATDTAGGIVELATAAEAQALSDAVRALTPATLAAALQGSNVSLNSNGYQKLPGGLIVQWGTGSAVANGNSTVTFPIAFPTACLHVMGTPFYGVTGNQTVCTLVSNTTTQAVFYMFNVTNGGLAVAPKWIAIGY